MPTTKKYKNPQYSESNAKLSEEKLNIVLESSHLNATIKGRVDSFLRNQKIGYCFTHDDISTFLLTTP